MGQKAKKTGEELARASARTRRNDSAFSKVSYLQWLPAYLFQRLARRQYQGPVHLILALADHFEPAIVPGNGRARASHDEQERRLENWCRDYPLAVQQWRDSVGLPLVHTYFYPAEQYDRVLLDRLAQHCDSGWGEVEIHLHHGIDQPATLAGTRALLLEFRDVLAKQHGCLSYVDGSDTPHYAFVHGDFALANATGGYGCGVDREMEVLAETGCYADLTLPAAAFHRGQISKINSLYECGLPLDQRAPHRKGKNLRQGRRPQIFPLIVQGPLMLDFNRSSRTRLGRFDTAALTDINPPSLRRMRLWKQAGITVEGRPDWLFIKLHCHSMFPNHRDAVLGESFQKFLSELVGGAVDRKETLHFVTAREMVNIMLAACDGRDGDPSEYRDYRLRLASEARRNVSSGRLASSLGVKG